MKQAFTTVGLLLGILSAQAQTVPTLSEIRTASPTELVAFFTDTNVSGPVWGTSYSTNAGDHEQPRLVDAQWHARDGVER